MPFSDEYHRLNALEAALEWMLFRLVATSQEPRSVLADFATHMRERGEMIEQVGLVALRKDDIDTFSNASDAKDTLNQLAETLINSVTIGEQPASPPIIRSPSSAD